jgi:hypothetical protein
MYCFLTWCWALSNQSHHQCLALLLAARFMMLLYLFLIAMLRWHS